MKPPVHQEWSAVVNGETRHLYTAPGTRLVDLPRDQLRLTGLKFPARSVDAVRVWSY